MAVCGKLVVKRISITNLIHWAFLAVIIIVVIILAFCLHLTWNTSHQYLKIIQMQKKKIQWNKKYIISINFVSSGNTTLPSFVGMVFTGFSSNRFGPTSMVLWATKREPKLRFSTKAVVTVRVRKLISATWWWNRPWAFYSRANGSTANYHPLRLWGHCVLCIAHRWTFCRAPSGWVQRLQKTERPLPSPLWWTLWGKTQSHLQQIII